MEPIQLNIAAICRKTNALGPGSRSVVWVQGCPFRCKGCISPQWIPIRKANLVDPVNLAKALLADPEINGITISGGEPILQASALVTFIDAAKNIRDIDTVLFSGYYIEDLKAFPHTSSIHRLLTLIDVLIDGPYVAELNNNLGMRGSSNQRVIHLTDRLNGWDFMGKTRQAEVQISDGELLFVGVPPNGMIPAIVNSLRGIDNLPVSGGKYEWT